MGNKKMEVGECSHRVGEMRRAESPLTLLNQKTLFLAGFFDNRMK